MLLIALTKFQLTRSSVTPLASIYIRLFDSLLFSACHIISTDVSGKNSRKVTLDIGLVGNNSLSKFLATFN